MGIPLFGQGCMNGDGLLPIDKVGSNFGFIRGDHDVSHDHRDVVDGSIEVRVGGWWVMGLHGVATEELVSSNMAVGVGIRKVGGVAVHMEDHVASNTGNNGVEARGEIIEK